MLQTVRQADARPSHSKLPGLLLHRRDAARSLKRVFLRLVGISFAIAAAVMFLLAVGLSDEGVSTRTLVASLFGLVGIFTWRAGAPVMMPTVEVDLVRKEIRLVRGPCGRTETIALHPFAKLAKVKITGHFVQFWLTGGRLAAEVSVTSDASLARLRNVIAAEKIPV